MSIMQQRIAELDSALAPYATKHAEARREFEERAAKYELPFNSDIQRISGLIAYHSLSRKTQIFFSPKLDCIFTRRSHTRSVANDAMYIGYALRLNVPLLEAIAMGHDIGHTPFGHDGEKALNRILPITFKHYEQSHRIATLLEPANLTIQVLDGILNHSSGKGFSGDTKDNHKIHESSVIQFVDKTAETVHDIKDLLTFGIIGIEDIPQKALERFDITKKDIADNRSLAFSTIREKLLDSIIDNSQDLDKAMTNRIRMGQNEQDAIIELKNFRYEIFESPEMQKRGEYAADAVRMLYDYYKKHPEQMFSSELHKNMKNNMENYSKYLKETDVDRQFADLFSSLSDKSAKNLCYDISKSKASKIFGDLNRLNEVSKGGILLG